MFLTPNTGLPRLVKSVRPKGYLQYDSPREKDGPEGTCPSFIFVRGEFSSDPKLIPSINSIIPDGKICLCLDCSLRVLETPQARL